VKINKVIASRDDKLEGGDFYKAVRSDGRTDSSRIFRSKIEVVVISAAWVEAGPAEWAKVAAVHVFPDRQFVAASSAENCPKVPLGTRPHLDGMACKEFVAILAGIVDAAASHPDGNDVDRRAIMEAPGLPIYFHSLNFRFWQLHFPIRTQGRNRSVALVRKEFA
jgi:hypothetical protein